jgi:dCTP deaminase
MSSIIDLQPGFDYRALAEEYTQVVDLARDGTLTIEPHAFIMGQTRERVHFPESSRLAARIEGKSTLARIGLAVHLTAPTIQVGFEGVLALEMVNNGNYPIRLRPGIRICQIIIEQVFGTPDQMRTGAFQNQASVLGSSMPGAES